MKAVQHPLELAGERPLFLGGSRTLTSPASLKSVRVLEELAHIVCPKSITLCRYPHHSFVRKRKHVVPSRHVST
jgi:hypothetical protein